MYRLSKSSVDQKRKLPLIWNYYMWFSVLKFLKGYLISHNIAHIHTKGKYLKKNWKDLYLQCTLYYVKLHIIYKIFF